MILRKHLDEFIFLFQIMMQDSDLGCFQEFNLKEFRERFQEKMSE